MSKRVLVAWMWVGLGSLLTSVGAALVGFFVSVVETWNLPSRGGLVDLPWVVGAALMAPVGILFVSVPCTLISALATSFGACVSGVLRSKAWGVAAAAGALGVVLYQLDRHGVSLAYGRGLELDDQGRWLVPMFVLLPILGPFALARPRAWLRGI